MYLNFEVKMFINLALKIICVLYYTMFLPYKLFILKQNNLKKKYTNMIINNRHIILSLNLVRITCLRTFIILL